MTPELPRRDVVKFAAALAAGAASAHSAWAQQPIPPAGASGAEKNADEALALARQSPQGFMLSAPAIIALDAERRTYDLVITSARDEQRSPVRVYVRPRSVRIFRADPTVDAFTRQGGLHWRYRDKPGQVQLNHTPDSALFDASLGPLVMIVRDLETVRVYTLTPDLRC